MTWGSVPPEESNLGAELALIDWSRDAIVISHLRTDHYLYLVPLRYGARYRKKGQERIDVWVPTGGIEHLRLLGACLSTTQPFFESAFAFHEYVPDSLFTIGSMVLTAVPVWHSIPAHALRVVASERTFVFSSDTAPCARLDEVATGADLLIAETTFGTKAYAPGGQLHLGGPDAGRVARVANARHLVLTHFIPGTDREAVHHSTMREFDGVVTIARPHLVMTAFPLPHHLVQHVGCAVQEFVEVGAFDHQGRCKGHVLVPAPRNEPVLARKGLELLGRLC